jgi:hypothetical protein
MKSEYSFSVLSSVSTIVERTGRNSTLYQASGAFIKTPITLPFRHCSSNLEVICQMIRSLDPGGHLESAEAASRIDVGHGNHPALHRPGLEFSLMN